MLDGSYHHAGLWNWSSALTSEQRKFQGSPYPRANILGVGVSAINLTQAVATIDDWISRHEQHYVTVTPVHGIMDCQDDPELKTIFNRSGLTTPDGMAVVWILKMLGHDHVGRVYGPDLMSAVCEQSVDKGYRHFLYGGEPDVAERLSASLQARCPGIKIAGIYCPPFQPVCEEEDRAIIDAVNDSGADIVWVGISTPKQERWMAAHLEKLEAPVMIGVGAAFDYLSGRKRQAPRWIQRAGFEWLFRLLMEPSRLWRRYIRYPLFLILLLGQALGIKTYPRIGAAQESWGNHEQNVEIPSEGDR